MIGDLYQMASPSALKSKDLGDGWSASALLYCEQQTSNLEELSKVTGMPVTMVRIKLRRARVSKVVADADALSAAQREQLMRVKGGKR